jgi:Right handed beta helix region
VTIRNNTADLNGRWGILSGFSDDRLIENNVTSRSQVEHGIYVSNSGDRPVIRGNVSWGNRANGIHMNGDLSQGGDGLISNALVEGNTIYENGRGGGSGINCDGVQDSRIQNNLLFDNHASGISLYRIDGGDGSRNNVIAHNTIVQAADARWAINIQNASTGNRLRNNILYNQHSFRGSISLSADSLPGFASDFNVVMERFTLDDGGSVLTLAQWRSATAQDTHSLVASPAQLFVSAAGHDYHLIASSPARDAGLTLAEVARDIAGTPRPVGSASDIGAFELADATLVAAVLPSSRSVQVNVPATAFATVIASGPGAPTGCTIAAATTAQLAYTYQTTNPATNAVTGTPNAPFSMAPGSFQTFVLGLTPTAPFPPTDVPFNVQCANTGPAAIISGLNTLLMSASDTPVPDIVALGVTMTHDGIVNIPGLSGVGAFAVGTVNMGTGGSIVVSATTGAATLPVSILVCQTDPATGVCITGMASTVLTTIPAGATPTFAVFVTGLGNVPFNPAVHRVFVRFTDAGGVVRGATSVAIRTQ